VRIMDFNFIGLLLGSAWASGVNVYLTIAGLGIAQRLQWVDLPGEMGVIAHPLVIGVAIVLYLIEFVADKVPYVDSVWDTFHTLIRPLGGFILGYLAMKGVDPSIQTSVALLTGGIALNSHLTKATARVAINTSPEPVTNSVASITEDVSVFGALYLIIQHPLIIGVLVVLFLVFSIWFFKVMFKFLKKVFRFPQKKPTKETA